MVIIALSNQKGGVGKTTTAAAIWAALPKSLGIDLDTQGNFTIATEADEDAHHNIYDVLTGQCSAETAIQKLPQNDFISSTTRLAELTELPPTTLRDALAPVQEKYQNVILDTPPVFNAATINALSVADILIIPIHGDMFSLRGLEQLTDIIDVIREETNPKLRIAGLLLTRFNTRSVLRRKMRTYAEEFAASIGTRVFKSTIREAIAVSEAQAMGKDIFSYAPKAKVAEDYISFIEELKEVLKYGKI